MYLALAVVIAALGWFTYGFKCDEGCYSYDPTATGEPWGRYQGSWQWHLFWVGGVMQLAAAVGPAVGVHRRRWAGAIALGLLQALLTGGLLALSNAR